MSIIYHIDKNPGLTTSKTVVKEINNAQGQHYWEATEQIESIFGSKVNGELKGIGKTKEQALERLEEDRKNLYDSLWV